MFFCKTSFLYSSFLRRKAEMLSHHLIYGGGFLTVVKIIELIGSSPNSWSEAAQNAVTEAAKTIKNIKGIQVRRCTAKVKNNQIVEYNADIKIAFIVER
jgi:flavin-binding protein dodecin